MPKLRRSFSRTCSKSGSQRPFWVLYHEKWKLIICLFAGLFVCFTLQICLTLPGIHGIVFYAPKPHVVFALHSSSFCWLASPPIVRSIVENEGYEGLTFQCHAMKEDICGSLSCTIDKVLLLHSVVLPKMVVRSVHKKRKWETSRGNAPVLYRSYLRLKLFLNLVPAFCEKGHKSH